jgi:hypothetical protein
LRYEIRTLPIGQEIEEYTEENGREYLGRVVEILNIRPEARQFRALVEVFELPPVAVDAITNNDAGIWGEEEE